jgi:hypothetical protein
MTRHGFWRRFLPVWLVGLAGIAGLFLQPVPTALSGLPEVQRIPPLTLRLLLAVNPAILVTLMAAAGAAWAHRLGLQSALAGTSAGPLRARALAPVLAAGLVLGVLVMLLDAAWAGLLGPDWQQVLLRSRRAAVLPALGAGILYGGLTEEVMMRWGLMTIVAALVARISGRPGATAMLTGAVVAALLFGLGHLPAVAQELPLTPGIAARTVTLNFLPGLVFGWLFWRRGLEAAMVAHAGAHLGFALVRFAS